MDYFIDMNIDDLLKLQQDIKKIKEYDGKLKHRNDLYLFKENESFFNDISNDINEKFDDVNTE